MATLRAEISHTRAAVRGAIASRPYRLTVPVRVDALDVLDRLHQGDLAGAVERYDSQLLPLSEAPLIVERRYHLDVALRTALLLNGTTSELLRFAAVHPFDVEVLAAPWRSPCPGIPTCRRRSPRWPSPPPSCDRARRRAGAARRGHGGGRVVTLTGPGGVGKTPPRDRLRAPAPGAHRRGRHRRAAGVDPRRCGGAGARRRARFRVARRGVHRARRAQRSRRARQLRARARRRPRRRRRARPPARRRSWPPAGNRSVSPASRSSWSHRSRCRRRAAPMPRRRPPSRCSSSAPPPPARCSTRRPRCSPTSPSCAAGSTGCRWRSSWRRPGRGASRPATCLAAVDQRLDLLRRTRAGGRWARLDARRDRAVDRRCWLPTNGRCSDGSACSPARSTSASPTPSPVSPAPIAWRRSTRSPASSSARWSVPRSPGRSRATGCSSCCASTPSTSCTRRARWRPSRSASSRRWSRPPTRSSRPP